MSFHRSLRLGQVEMENILSIEGITVSYGPMRILNSLTFDVKAGEVLGVIGPNGAGKTTVLNALCGLTKIQSGKIVYKGSDISSLSAAKRCRIGIGRTYQIPQPYGNMTVFENVMVGGVHGAGLSEKQAKAKSLEVLALTGMLEKKDSMAGKLTLLDRKRLEVARALATNPQVLLLDEVASGLTEAEVRAVMQIVADTQKSGVTIVWIEHIIMTMLEATNRLLCLAAGTSLVCGVPQEIMASKEVEKVYLGVEEV